VPALGLRQDHRRERRDDGVSGAAVSALGSRSLEMFARYETVREGFLAGRHRRPEWRFELPEIAALPKARIVVPDAWPNDISPPDAALPPGVRLPRSSHRRPLQEMLRRQYAYLRDCTRSDVIRRRFGGRTYEGVVSSPDPAVYGAQWSVDHFFNSGWAS